MQHQLRFSNLLLAGLVLALGVSPGSANRALAARAPVAVSPGDATKVALIEGRCPTFSWGEVEGAKSYDLVVYRLGEQNEHEEPVLRRSFPGSVDGWTPALDQCLERGGRYAWSVRAVGGQEASEWSGLSLFAVAPGPSKAEFEEALQVVRQYQEEAAAGRGLASAVSPSGEASAPSATAPGGAASFGPTPQSMIVGDSALQVNGSAVVTTATLGAAVACWSVVPGKFYRYVDLNDGTVLDCNTGLIWLRDASCAALPGTDASGRGSWDTAQSAAALLEDGTCGLTDGSVAGDWRLPTIQEFCNREPVDGESCPPELASSSLLDGSLGSVSGVAISNAAGTGQASEGDPFVGPENSVSSPGFCCYWSATEFAAFPSTIAWRPGLRTGHMNFADKTEVYYIWPVRNAR